MSTKEVRISGKLTLHDLRWLVTKCFEFKDTSMIRVARSTDGTIDIIVIDK